MKLFLNKALGRRIQALERFIPNQHASRLDTSATNTLHKRMLSSMSEAYYADGNFELDAQHFGYRVVSPVPAGCYTSSVKTYDYHEDCDDYNLNMTNTTEGMSHTLGTITGSTIDATVFLSVKVDALQAIRGWDFVFKTEAMSGVTSEEQEEDDPYYSDFEEMEEDWDIEAGVHIVGSEGVDEVDLALE